MIKEKQGGPCGKGTKLHSLKYLAMPFGNGRYWVKVQLCIYPLFRLRLGGVSLSVAFRFHLNCLCADFFFCFAVFRLTAFALLHSLPFSFRAPLAITCINAWDFVGTLNFRLIGLNLRSCPSHSSPFGVILLWGMFHYLRLAASLFIPHTFTNHVSPAYFYETQSQSPYALFLAHTLARLQEAGYTRRFPSVFIPPSAPNSSSTRVLVFSPTFLSPGPFRSLTYFGRRMGDYFRVELRT
jgi:hypothetical protein